MHNHRFLLFSVVLSSTLLLSFNQDHLTYALTERHNLQNLDLSGANLSNQDLTCCDLSYSDLSGADLSSTNLTCAQLFKTKLRLTNLEKTDFYCAQLTSIDLSLTNWQDAINLNCAETKHVMIGHCPSSIVNSTLHPNYASKEIDHNNDNQNIPSYLSKKRTTPPGVVYYENACPICSKTYTPEEEIAVLPCGHTLCHSHNLETDADGCIFKLIATYGKQCPLCKQHFSHYACIHIPPSTNTFIPPTKPN